MLQKEKATVNPFTDTYDAEVLKAYNPGITNGTSETTFSPEELITREQMATIKWHILEEQPTIQREDIDFNVFENHLNLRMNTTMFKYDVLEEQKFIFNNQDYVYNEYPVNRVFVKKYKK